MAETLVNQAKPVEQPEKATPPDPFETAVAGYHERVRASIAGYEKQLGDLNTKYLKAIEAAQREKTPALVQQKINAANEEAAQGLQKALDAANEKVVQGLRQYFGDMKKTWCDVKIDDLNVVKLASIGQEMWFIANAAVGAFPATWWNPRT